jgi:hypothetical protein
MVSTGVGTRFRPAAAAPTLGLQRRPGSRSGSTRRALVMPHHPERQPAPGSAINRALLGAVGGPRLVHTPSEPSGSQRSPAVRRPCRSRVRSCRNRPGWRTLIRMRSSWNDRVPDRCGLTSRRPRSVDGQCSRPVAAGRPQAEAAAQAASGSRSWCHRRGHTARRRRPARPRWPGRRRAAPRTAPAALRSAGPGPGRARSPPNQSIEHKFEIESQILPTPRAATLIVSGHPEKIVNFAMPGPTVPGGAAVEYPARSWRSDGMA